MILDANIKFKTGKEWCNITETSAIHNIIGGWIQEWQRIDH